MYIKQDYEDEEGNPVFLHDSCPVCHHEFDEIDIEYQLCSICGCDATKFKD
jgi:hypothetical protein